MKDDIGILFGTPAPSDQEEDESNSDSEDSSSQSSEEETELIKGKKAEFFAIQHDVTKSNIEKLNLLRTMIVATRMQVIANQKDAKPKSAAELQAVHELLAFYDFAVQQFKAYLLAELKISQTNNDFKSFDQIVKIARVYSAELNSYLLANPKYITHTIEEKNLLSNFFIEVKKLPYAIYLELLTCNDKIITLKRQFIGNPEDLEKTLKTMQDEINKIISNTKFPAKQTVASANLILIYLNIARLPKDPNNEQFDVKLKSLMAMCEAYDMLEKFTRNNPMVADMISLPEIFQSITVNVAKHAGVTKLLGDDGAKRINAILNKPQIPDLIILLIFVAIEQVKQIFQTINMDDGKKAITFASDPIGKALHGLYKSRQEQKKSQPGTRLALITDNFEVLRNNIKTLNLLQNICANYDESKLSEIIPLSYKLHREYIPHLTSQQIVLYNNQLTGVVEQLHGPKTNAAITDNCLKIMQLLSEQYSKLNDGKDIPFIPTASEIKTGPHKGPS